jgi:hypothetical protein
MCVNKNIFIQAHFLCFGFTIHNPLLLKCMCVTFTWTFVFKRFSFSYVLVSQFSTRLIEMYVCNIFINTCIQALFLCFGFTIQHSLHWNMYVCNIYINIFIQSSSFLMFWFHNSQLPLLKYVYVCNIYINIYIQALFLCFGFTIQHSLYWNMYVCNI